MKAPAVIAIDFESHGILPRPEYPPVPVGVSIQWPGERKATYHAWGHPEGNNTTKEGAKKALAKAYDSEFPLLFHHGKFDIDVGEIHMGMPRLDWRRYHDTLYLLFLCEPHMLNFDLKVAAHQLFGMKPNEKDAIQEWLVAHKIIKKGKKKFGEHIWRVPGPIVGKYANGDIKRTLRLFNGLWPSVAKQRMLEAYDVERELMPYFLDSERAGIRVDVKALKKDVVAYQNSMVIADAWLKKRLNNKDLNIDSSAEFAEALAISGVVTDWTKTKTGKRAVNKKVLTLDKFKDKRVAAVFGYRQRLKTCLGTFMEPWLAQALKTGGVIHTNWNQVRQSKDAKDSKGARTGRMSSNPNFQNIPKILEGRSDDFVHPKFLKVTPLPVMRKYILPDKGCVFGHRDYNQQEFRILAHYEDGKLKQTYLENPRADLHQFVKDTIHELFGLDLERTIVKNINFGIVYGLGATGLSIWIKDTVDAAYHLKRLHEKALPDLYETIEDIKILVKAGKPIRTYGGRLYYVEDPKIIDGKKRTFEYKILNYLIQGSAADTTKRALLNYFRAGSADSRFLLSVHDEINISIRSGRVRQEMAHLRDCMESVKFDVPMLSDGKIGKSWSTLTKYKEKQYA